MSDLDENNARQALWRQNARNVQRHHGAAPLHPRSAFLGGAYTAVDDDRIARALFHAAVDAGGSMQLEITDLALRLKMGLSSGNVYTRYAAERRLKRVGLSLSFEADHARIEVIGYQEADAARISQPLPEPEPEPGSPSNAALGDRPRPIVSAKRSESALNSPDGTLAASAPSPPHFAIADNAGDALRDLTDKVAEPSLKRWWSRRSTTERWAMGAIALAIAIGPLGQGLPAGFGALFDDKIPSSKQLEALLWLLWIALPLVAFILVVVVLAGRISGGTVAILAGIAAVSAAAVVEHSPAPKQLAGLYCYADARDGSVLYEQECREFNTSGFIAENEPRMGNPSSATEIYASAVAYTADARGTIMALSAILASVGVGLLIRRQAA